MDDITRQRTEVRPCIAHAPARLESIAHRLLSGAGRSSLVAYRLSSNNTVSSLTHGLGSDGTLFVATLQADMQILAGASWDVRFSIEKQACAYDKIAIAYALHALGSVQWLGDETCTNYRDNGVLPPHIAHIANAGGMVGVVQAPRLLLHDAGGVREVFYRDVIDKHCAYTAHASRDDSLFTAPLSDLLCADEIETYGENALWELAQRIRSGVCGAVISSVDVDGVTVGTLCLDIDRTGMLLLDLDGTSMTTVFYPFASFVSTVSDLRAQLRRAFSDL